MGSGEWEVFGGTHVGQHCQHWDTMVMADQLGQWDSEFHTGRQHGDDRAGQWDSFA